MYSSLGIGRPTGPVSALSGHPQPSPSRSLI